MNGVFCGVKRARSMGGWVSSNNQRENRCASERRKDSIKKTLSVKKLQRSTERRLGRSGCSSEIAMNTGRCDGQGGVRGKRWRLAESGVKRPSISVSAIEVLIIEERVARTAGSLKSWDEGLPPLAKALRIAVILTASGVERESSLVS